MNFAAPLNLKMIVLPELKMPLVGDGHLRVAIFVAVGAWMGVAVDADVAADALAVVMAAAAAAYDIVEDVVVALTPGTKTIKLFCQGCQL